MLKEVGASGQISLGKKYAGQLFDMQIAADGAVTLTPVKVVPVVQPQAMQEELAAYNNKAGIKAMNKRVSENGSMARSVNEWTNENVQRIEQYNVWAEQRQPYSQRVRQWREAK